MEAAVELTERWMGITRLELEVYTDNAPAIALYKKFGFEVEGTLREYALRDGQYVDSYLMARVRQ
jgi:putative acetyltransferase